VTDKVYGSRWELIEDVARIMSDEMTALQAEGVPYIQVDNAHYPDYIPEDRRAAWRAIGIDPDQALDEDIRADNLASSGLDRSRVILANHICRGNGRSAWHTEGGYDRIAEKVFGQLDVDRFLLEYDSDRAGGFEPLRFVPRGKQVVLGLVTTKVGAMEKQDDLLRRVEEASRFVPTENLALSPQCGFASIEQGNLLSWDEQKRKLELVVSTAQKIWG
jgi:methionine synthase II (cobalamin-independent)